MYIYTYIHLQRTKFAPDLPSPSSSCWSSNCVCVFLCVCVRARVYMQVCRCVCVCVHEAAASCENCLVCFFGLNFFWFCRMCVSVRGGGSMFPPYFFGTVGCDEWRHVYYRGARDQVARLRSPGCMCVVRVVCVSLILYLRVPP